MTSNRLSPPLALSPLVGREKELDRLAQVIERAPAVAMLEGEAGIGKTRLVRELLQSGRVARRSLVLVGHCQPVREPSLFGPIVDALSGATEMFEGVRFSAGSGAVARILPEVGQCLPEPPEPLADPRAERHLLLRALRQFLHDLGPTVLALEDLHWADEATLEFLGFLKARFPPDLILLGTYRGEELDAGSSVRTMCSRLEAEVAGEHLELHPLDVGEVGQLVSAILETDEVSEEFAAHLCDRTGGIPLVVEEMVRLLQDRRDIVRQDIRWARTELDQLEIPGSLSGAILERLDRIPESARTLIEAAAVVGIPATEDLISRIAGLAGEEVTEAACQALSAALLQESTDGRLRFRHPLARQAVYEALAGPTRRRLHLHAAEELAGAQPKRLALLAHHYREARNVPEWLRYAEAAADAAASLGDDAEALRLLLDAIDVAPRSHASRARLAVKLGRAAYHARDHRQALGLLRRILAEEALDVNQRGELRLLLGMLLDSVDDEASFSQIERAATELEDRPALQARAMAALAIPTLAGPHMGEHLKWSHRALAILEKVDDPVIRMAVHSNHAAILLATGEPSAWDMVSRVPRANTVEEQREKVRSSHSIGAEALGAGHYLRSEEQLLEAERLAGQMGYERLQPLLEDLRCALDWAMGRWVSLEVRCRDLCTETGGQERSTPDAEIILGRVLMVRGEFEEADTRLQRAIRFASAHGDTTGLLSAIGARAEILLGTGRSALAKEEAMDGVEVIRRKGAWTWVHHILPVAVAALVAHEDHGEAESLVHECAGELQERDAPAARAALLMSQGRVAAARGSWGKAARFFERAESALRSLPSPYETALALEERGAALSSLQRSARTQPDSGRTQLEGALAAFERLGAVWDSGRVRRRLREHGFNLVHRRGRRGYGRELSPREQEVVRLVGRDLTNREIAERLYLSVSTVKQHVGSAMRKVGCSSRNGLKTLETVAANK